MLEFNNDENDCTFELVVQVRHKDKNGNLIPTGKTRTIKTNDASRLAEFWENNEIKNKKKKHYNKNKKKNKQILPNSVQANQILRDMAIYAEKKQQERNK